MKLSYVIHTYNRREALLATLDRLLGDRGRHPWPFETLVVDNASTDGSADAVRHAFPAVRVMRLRHNQGMPARNHALLAARGSYAMILDDDSYPIGDTIDRAIQYMDRHANTAAVTGRVLLPNGRAEASALPSVTIGCATLVRRSALGEVGLFPWEFFRQAEEYDLSFRLWQAGYRVDRFEDLVFQHDKALGGRRPAMVHRLDLRNNLILAQRYLPQPLRAIYHADWDQRYTAIARYANHGLAAQLGRWQARGWRLREMARGRQTMSSTAVESVFQLRHQAQTVASWARTHRVRRVVIADLSKNIYATWRACQEAGLQVTAIADPNPAFQGLGYRGAEVVAEDQLLQANPDGIVLSNINPAHVQRRADRLRAIAGGVRLLTLWWPKTLTEQPPKVMCA